VSAEAGGRRLAAILAADVVGYSRMVAADEAGRPCVSPERIMHSPATSPPRSPGWRPPTASNTPPLACVFSAQGGPGYQHCDPLRRRPVAQFRVRNGDRFLRVSKFVRVCFRRGCEGASLRRARVCSRWPIGVSGRTHIAVLTGSGDLHPQLDIRHRPMPLLRPPLPHPRYGPSEPAGRPYAAPSTRGTRAPLRPL
jgi:hypothetical protein